jgi:UDP-N-acetylmuramate--alanine ligase
VENMRAAFVEFAGKLKPNGLLLTRFGLPGEKLTAAKHVHYSLQNDAADVYASNITMHNGSYEFDVMAKDWMIDKVALHMGGMHNVENAVAAITMAHHLQIDPDKIKKAVASFKGVKRRFEYVINASEAAKQKNDVVYIDDYAHHPEELKALIKSAKSLFSKRRCTVIFQPHLFTRTRDFAKEFAEALDLADEILILPIYPARELLIEGVTSELILKRMENKNADIISKEQLLSYLENNYLKSVRGSSYGQLLITAGAGNIDQLIQPIKKILLNSK